MGVTIPPCLMDGRTSEWSPAQLTLFIYIPFLLFVCVNRRLTFIQEEFPSLQKTPCVYINLRFDSALVWDITDLLVPIHLLTNLLEGNLMRAAMISGSLYIIIMVKRNHDYNISVILIAAKHKIHKAYHLH